MYYVIPDIHGRYDLLEQALNYIYNKQDSGKIVFLGDYIDRGKQNVDVLLTVMNPPEGWKFVTLKGNHEQIFHLAYNRYCEYYDMKAVREIIDDDRIEMTKVVAWFEQLPIVHVQDKNIFVHAFYDSYTVPDKQNEDYVLWQRYSDTEAFVHPDGKFLTHGHTPRKNGPIVAKNRCNLDCGAPYHGRLTIGEYKEGVAGPVSFVEFEG